MKKFFILLALIIILVTAAYQRGLISNNMIFPSDKASLVPSQNANEKKTVVYEESVITKIVEEAIPSVVTIGVKKTIATGDFYTIDPFDLFSPFRRIPGQKKNIEQNIGSGFIITDDGLILTNKHVVADTEATYQVLTYDKKKYDVEKIYRDPLNDLAILKISPKEKLKPLKLGDSSKLKLGQLVVAIGTPLGEFTNTVTSGIISGLGRGITAGSPLEGYVEKLDNVIQTDAAINPGNSGGPLLNSSGEVIGINTAIAQEGQNIGFAIPVNTAKEIIENFQKRGGVFERPFLGIRYKMIDKQTAILNDVVEGAYVIEVITNSPAEKAGIQKEDIIIEFDGKKVQGSDDQGLAKMIMEKKVGETVNIKIWRSGEKITLPVTIASSNQ
jgi:S1-C subfamily serine protease